MPSSWGDSWSDAWGVSWGSPFRAFTLHQIGRLPQADPRARRAVDFTQLNNDLIVDKINEMLDDFGVVEAEVNVLQATIPVFNSAFVDVGNVGTGETTLYTLIFAPTVLAANGDVSAIRFGGIFIDSAGTATRQIRLRFNGSLIFDTGAVLIGANSSWMLFADVIRVSNTVIRITSTLTTTDAPLASYVSYVEVTGLDLAGNTYNLILTGEADGVGAASDDIVAKMGYSVKHPV